jgi:hypothetical protein
MTPDEMERAIYDAFAAPYAEFITPALAQQFAISARNAMHRIQAGMKDKSRPQPPRSWKEQSADRWKARERMAG